MKTTQYVQQEKVISAADSGGIRQRWLWGLRLLRDPEAISPGGGGLKHGVAASLVEAAAKRGLKLSDREIRWRLQCARAYGTEAEIGNAITDFETWSGLIQAGFPPVAKPDDEPHADHRTQEEVRRDRARQLADMADPQGALFPLSRFEPVTTPLKELADYADEQEAITSRFVAHDAKRRHYLNRLIAAADGDLNVTWQAAHDRIGEA